MKYIKPFKSILIFVVIFQACALWLAFSENSLVFIVKFVLALNSLFLAYFVLSIFLKKKVMVNGREKHSNLSKEDGVFFAFTGEHFLFENAEQALVFPAGSVTDIFFENDILSVIIRYPLGGYLTLAPDRMRIKIGQGNAEPILQWFKTSSFQTKNKVFTFLVRDPIGRIVFGLLVMLAIFFFMEGV